MSESGESFMSHLIELRRCLIWIISITLVVALCLLPFANTLYTWLAKPLIDALPSQGRMISTDVVGVFVVPMKLALMTAFVLTLPHTLYRVWSFVAPGLYVHEKKLVVPLIVASVVLFVVGMGFAYVVVFPTVFHFMSATTPSGVAWMTDIDKYLSFVLGSFIAFGVTFEIPVVVLILVRMGIVTLAQLRAWRPYVIVGAFALAAVFTPPDVLSQLLLAVPMCLLYEVGLGLARFVVPKSPPLNNDLGVNESSQ